MRETWIVKDHKTGKSYCCTSYSEAEYRVEEILDKAVGSCRVKNGDFETADRIIEERIMYKNKYITIDSNLSITEAI